MFSENVIGDFWPDRPIIGDNTGSAEHGSGNKESGDDEEWQWRCDDGNVNGDGDGDGDV